MISDTILREMKKLALYTKEALPDMAHDMQMLTYVVYGYTTASVQLKSLSEGEKVVVRPSTFKKATGLPKPAVWNAASDKEMDSPKRHHVTHIVPSTYIPAVLRSVGRRWVYQINADKPIKGRLVGEGWGQAVGVDAGVTLAPTAGCRAFALFFKRQWGCTGISYTHPNSVSKR